MKGKILTIITAILFGASMVAAPIVMAAGTDTGTEEQAPKKKTKTKKTAKKKTAKKKTAKKTKSKKKKAAPKSEEKT